MENIQKRLNYLREQIENENISYGEIAELQGLKEHIAKDDVLLLEWAGVEENEEEDEEGDEYDKALQETEDYHIQNEPFTKL